MFKVDIGAQVAQEMDVLASSKEHQNLFKSASSKKDECECPSDCQCAECVEKRKKESSLSDAAEFRLKSFNALLNKLVSVSESLDKLGLTKTSEQVLESINYIIAEAYGDSNYVFPPSFDDALKMRKLIFHDSEAEKIFEEETDKTLEELDSEPGIELETVPGGPPTEIEDLFGEDEDLISTLPATGKTEPKELEDQEDILRSMYELEPLSEEEKSKYFTEANDWLDAFLAKRGAASGSLRKSSDDDLLDEFFADFEDED